jgi:hypothetical protein
MFSYKKVGGIRFIRIWRWSIQISYDVKGAGGKR